MIWGVFSTSDSEHIVPSDKEGVSLAPHILDEMCCCSPVLEMVEGSDRLLVIHNEEN